VLCVVFVYDVHAGLGVKKCKNNNKHDNNNIGRMRKICCVSNGSNRTVAELNSSSSIIIYWDQLKLPPKHKIQWKSMRISALTDWLRNFLNVLSIN